MESELKSESIIDFWDTPTPKKQPYQCPICYGKGIVPGEFYNSVGEYSTTSVSTEPCRSCGGTGIIWG